VREFAFPTLFLFRRWLLLEALLPVGLQRGLDQLPHLLRRVQQPKLVRPGRAQAQQLGGRRLVGLLEDDGGLGGKKVREWELGENSRKIMLSAKNAKKKLKMPKKDA
jgi:hypothetical protein